MINNRLLDLYQSYWGEILIQLQDTGLSNPLLLCLNDEKKYVDADIKVMFFGQETNGWEGELGSRSPLELCHTYSEFFGSGSCFTNGGHFWNAVKDYIATIKKLNPNKKIECLWNNILKMGMSNAKGAPKRELIEFQKAIFPVIPREIDILKPDIVIFFTGPYYDDWIQREWSDLELVHLPNWNNTRQLAILEAKELPLRSFRTYHPNYLYRRGSSFFQSVKDSITSRI